MWALRKEKQALTGEARKTLRRLFQLSPNLKTTYWLQNCLTAIFEQRLALL